MPAISKPSEIEPRLAPPLDVRDALIRLETHAVTEATARQLGYADLWGMAEAQFRAATLDSPTPAAPPKRSSGFAQYVKGIAFALPLAVTGLAMLFLNFSLWGGPLPADLGTAVAVGTVASFIVTGGFVQAMARRGTFYLGTKEPRACLESTIDWLGLGALALAITACTLLSVNWYIGWLTSQVALTATAFLLGLGLYWLATGILYMLDRNVEVLLAAVLGLAVVAVLHRGAGIPIVLAQIAGVVTAAGASILVSIRILSRALTPAHNQMAKEPFMRTVLSAFPWFLYGVLFYVFLFTDRIMAWTAQAGPVQLVFRADYEAAVNVALFAFVLQVGWVRVSGASYRDRVERCLRTFRAYEASAFNLSLKRFYWERLILFALISLASTLAVYFGSVWLGVIRNPGIHRVALYALAACPLLVWSLWNANLLFGLSRPWIVLRALGIASVANLLAGYVLSRVWGYPLSAAGSAFGAAVLCVLSTLSAVRTLDRCDHHHFASGA